MLDGMKQFVGFFMVGGLFLFLIFFFLMFFKYKKSKKGDGQDVSDIVDIEQDEGEKLDELIVSIQKQASLSGLHLTTSVNSLIDKFVSVKESLETVDRTDKVLLHSIPNDFNRLLSKHFPELISKYAAVVENDESKKTFEETLAQLGSEMDDIVSRINDRNFADFASKDKFMKIRFSNQF